MSKELPKQYDPAAFQEAVNQKWLRAKAFAAFPDERENRFVIMMPLPNVTGALHMGHAMDNVMQDLLIRWHRMMGDNTLWLPGTDHAGIATQAVVEKRLFELEGKTRHDLGREGLVARIWEWKEINQKRIVAQQQSMGCSCDWDRQRFTMDAVCTRAVRWTFFRMFRDGLIYRGARLVNWDCRLQTAVSDDEIVYEKVQSHFWHLKYPVIDPRPGEPEFVEVATTRPETMLGDTAVACHPDPAGVLDRLIREAREKAAAAPAKERADLEEEIRRLEERKKTHLPTLLKLAEMARQGRKVRLPLLDRPIPLILDEWAKPEKGSGCVKITPAHDPNDYQVWERHKEEIGVINILEPDGRLNAQAGPYKGLDRFEARKKVVEDLDRLGLLARVEDHEVEIGHSDRSKSPIEPYISLQWFVRMGDVEGGILCGRGTDKEFRAPGLAQAAMDAVAGDWRSPTGLKLSFHPDHERYANTYLQWLAEKRDWCISRQLWWGHRIPIWTGRFSGERLKEVLGRLEPFLGREDFLLRLSGGEGASFLVEPGKERPEWSLGEEEVEVQACPRDEQADRDLAGELEAAGLVQDPDVLDTWFSSALWPHSTLGWPDPETAPVDPGQPPLGSVDGRPDCLSTYYPGSCLVTGRDIITLWVARMVATGLYNLGDLPFEDVFIHANILDGKGERMSKSKGNGIDPVDIIERYGADAMRYVICELQTGTQDVRLPVQAISPYTGKLVDLAKAKHGKSVFTYLDPDTGKEFDVLGTMSDLPQAKLVSDRFEVGRAFCNKLWNAARFALMNLEEAAFQPREKEDLPAEDRWILSRLSRGVRRLHRSLEEYNPSAALQAGREFFWNEFCDWYLELIKPRLKDPARAPLARQVLAFVLDQVFRLFHPFLPFVTEALWEKLGEAAPVRGIREPLETTPLLIHAPWPGEGREWVDPSLEERFQRFKEVVRAVRDIRAKYRIPPTRPLDVTLRGEPGALDSLSDLKGLLKNLAFLGSLELSPDAVRARDAASAVVEGLEVFVAGVIDLEKEKARLRKEREKLLARIEGARKKLSNPAFLEKARPEVVERERETLSRLEAQLKALEANLASL